MPPPSLSSSISRHHQAPAEIEGQALRTSNFLRQVIEKDLATGTYAQRQWGGVLIDNQNWANFWMIDTQN